MERRVCFNTTGQGCGRTLPINAFHRQGRQADGSVRYTALCRDCNNAKNREYREANPERVSLWNRRYDASHKDEKTAYNETYYEANADRRRANERERYLANRPAILERRAEQRRASRAVG